MTMDESDRLDSGLSSSNRKSSAPDLNNLPESYTEDRSDSSSTGKSTCSSSWRNALFVDSLAEEDKEGNVYDPTIKHGDDSFVLAGAKVPAGCGESASL